MDLKEMSKKVASKVVQNYALEKMGIYDRVFNSNDNLLVRNVKKGSVWYFANETNDLIMGLPSNLTEMNTDKLIDDIAYYSLTSAVVENLRLDDTLENFNPVASMVSSDVNDAIISGVLQVGGEYLGDVVLSNLPNDNIRKIRHVTQFWK